jgi:cytochrome d oxidase subunit CydB
MLAKKTASFCVPHHAKTVRKISNVEIVSEARGRRGDIGFIGERSAADDALTALTRRPSRAVLRRIFVVVVPAAFATTPVMLRIGRAGMGFIISGIGVASVIATAGLSIFPFLLPSSLEPRASLTVWDASSSHLTLEIMLFATAVFLPLILLYTAWVYRVLRGPITAAFVDSNSHSVY